MIKIHNHQSSIFGLQTEQKRKKKIKMNREFVALREQCDCEMCVCVCVMRIMNRPLCGGSAANASLTLTLIEPIGLFYLVHFHPFFRTHSMNRVDKTEAYLCTLPLAHQNMMIKYRDNLFRIRNCIGKEHFIFSRFASEFFFNFFLR